MVKINRVLYYVVGFVAFLGLTSLAIPKLVKTQVAPGITMLVPKDWRPMDALDFNERYPSVRAPLAAYTDEGRVADVSVNISATQWPDADLNVAKDFFKSAIYNSFDRIEMIDEGVHEVNGKQYAYFEFESTVKGNTKDLNQREAILSYSYMQYLVESDRTLVFSFHCPRFQRNDWQEAAHKIMESIKVKKVSSDK